MAIGESGGTQELRIGTAKTSTVPPTIKLAQKPVLHVLLW
jgi:hypothetical protein